MARVDPPFVRDQIGRPAQLAEYLEFVDLHESKIVEHLDSGILTEPQRRTMLISLPGTRYRKYTCRYSLGASITELQVEAQSCLEALAGRLEGDGTIPVEGPQIVALCLLHDLRESFETINHTHPAIFLGQPRVYRPYERLYYYLLNRLVPQTLDVLARVDSGGKHRLLSIAKAADNRDEDSSANLVSYVRRYWYNEHKSRAWWNAHKRDPATYYGYWTFESAAIAKLHNLDDSSLEGHRYYPYDLAH